MEHIDKELGTLLDNYLEKFEVSQLSRQKQLKENQHFKNDFNKLVENVIIPEMNHYYTFLEDRGIGAAIIRSSLLHEAGHQGQSIILSFSYKKSLYHEFTLLISPSIKVVTENRKIAIYENKFDASGVGCCAREGVYETSQITESFVKEKLSNFFKTLFKREF
jgi:hypothetical protein